MRNPFRREITVNYDVMPLRVQQGDTLIIQSERGVSRDIYLKLKAQLEASTPGVSILLLEASLKVTGVVAGRDESLPSQEDIERWESEGGPLGRPEEKEARKQERIRRERDVQAKMQEVLEIERKSIMGPKPCAREIPGPVTDDQFEKMRREIEKISAAVEAARRQNAIEALRASLAYDWSFEKIVDFVLEHYKDPS